MNEPMDGSFTVAFQFLIDVVIVYINTVVC